MSKAKFQINPQIILSLILLVLVLAFGLINHAILSLANFYSLLRALIIPLMLALPQMLITALGGTDMSFTVISAISSYIPLFIWQQKGASPITSGVVILFCAMAIGIICYLLNWFFVQKVGISTFIATLGMNSLLKGFVLAFVSSSFVNILPESLKTFGTINVASAINNDGVVSVLHVSIIFVLLLYLVMYFVMEKTMFGRKIYAVGVDPDASRRAGIDVGRVRLFAFILAGAICGITGALHDSLSRFSMPLPADVVGKELDSIAAVIIGIGGSKKGKNIVIGTFLGVLLLEVISTNLVMLGVPSYWQQLVSGIIILLGLCLQAVRFDQK